MGVFGLIKALIWIKQNIHEFGGDPNFVVCGGESAGGHLATLLSLTANDLVYQPEHLDVDTRLKGCVNLYGVMDFTDYNKVYAQRSDKFEKFLRKLVMRRILNDENLPFYHRASPYWKIQQNFSPELPPIMTVHGLIDTLVPHDEAKHFNAVLSKNRLEHASYPVSDVFVSLPRAHHAFNFIISPRTLALGNAVIDFISHLHNAQSAKL